MLLSKHMLICVAGPDSYYQVDPRVHDNPSVWYDLTLGTARAYRSYVPCDISEHICRYTLIALNTNAQSLPPDTDTRQRAPPCVLTGKLPITSSQSSKLMIVNSIVISSRVMMPGIRVNWMLLNPRASYGARRILHAILTVRPHFYRADAALSS